MSSTTNRPGRVRVGRVVESTKAEGPGVRYAIWVQGCTIRCPGCFNPHLWGSAGGTDVAPEQLAKDVLRAAMRYPEIEGITLLGGEPFDQAEALARLARMVRARNLSVMVFTGFVREHLESEVAPAGAPALLAATDLLVDGPYVADQRDIVRPWVGSRNQRFHLLTDRYAQLADDLEAMPDRLEVRVSATGALDVNGWAGVDQLDALLADVAPRVSRGSIR